MDISKDGILKLRKQMGLSQEGFAGEVGVSLHEVWRWERGISKPSRLAVKALGELWNKVNKGGQ